jgi:hypothetical protein
MMAKRSIQPITPADHQPETSKVLKPRAPEEDGGTDVDVKDEVNEDNA